MPVFNVAQNKQSKRAMRRAALRDAETHSDSGEDHPDVEEQQEEIVAESNETAPQAKGEGSETTMQFNEPQQWIERMALTATKSLPSDINPDDDPKREEVFMQHALLSVKRGIQMLERANVPWKRPDDYFAEMYKDDVHMHKIKESMMASKSRIEARAQRRAVKDQKKFGKEVQAEVLRQRAKYKRDMEERISDWRKKKRGGGSIDDAIEEEEMPDRKKARGENSVSRAARGARPKNLKPGGSKRPGKNARRRLG